ncbi:TPA: penicillin-binding protein 2 [Candidatus Nomurabacteria bacterium]|nr:MAG: hypothetical protein O210_OD1C00001G0151 [Parcubacteria bacterium RAAC4_OD1_1]HCY26652.1 penicillin-binding protein 2 [Candidatus Nomurabacteria bacterium]
MAKTSPFIIRIRIVSVFVLFVAFVLVTRLFFVQVIHKNYYEEKADRQFATPSGNIFDRGNIFFTKKDGSLITAATVSTGFKIALNTNKLEDKENAYTKLSPYLEIEESVFMERASKINDPYEEVAINLTKEQADEIEKMKIPGVSIFKDNWRFYPGENLASHTLGFIAYKGNDRVGQYGLERYYNDVLSKSKDEMYVNFFAEIFSNIEDSFSREEKIEGDIVTTIEPQVEYMLESELRSSLDKWDAELAGGIIMDPITGEIYAMAGMPDFDLNNFKEVNNISIYRNPLVENVFEFGSVIKPLVVATGLDLGVITPETNYYDSGSVIVNKKEIKNFDDKGRGNVTVQDILDQSLNTGMVYIESKIGHSNFRNYMKSYGIGERTGIDLPNETYGLIKNLESPRDIEYANAAFGQGIALTPIGAVRAFSSLANGGNLVTPHIIKEIKYENGASEILEYPYVKENLIKKESADTITRMLVHVFESYNNGSYKINSHSIATKTGTAQVAMEGGGGYYPDKHMHSFFGYFPAYNPRFIVFLFLKDPKGIRYASETLIPPFLNITKFLLNYYNVPPDR